MADKWTLPPISSELNGTDFQVFLNKANDWYDDYRRKKPRPNLNDTVPKVPDILFGVETMIFQINWGAFSDKKLGQAFRKWVVDARPPTVPEPACGRGHNRKEKLRMLRDLGIMRLMYFAEVPNMERRFPDAWALYHDQLHWTERYWYLARARAVKHFRSLLRFLPHGELPIHGDRKSRKGKAPN